MKIVVSPGLPRSGTTYLYNQLAYHNETFFNRSKVKEVNAFNQELDQDSFRAFFETKNDSLYYIDFSPAYLIAKIPAIDNILNFDAEKKIILNLRNPIDQIYAHYLHDLKAHYASMQHGIDIWRPLWGRDSMQKYLALHGDAIERTISAVGRENVLVVNFHKDLADPIALTKKVSAFLELPLKAFKSEHVGRGGWLPYYIYSGEAGLDYVIGNEIFVIPPKTLVLVNGIDSAVWPNTDPTLAARLIQGASSWTRFVSSEQYDVLYNGIADDWEKTLRLLDLDPVDFEVERDFAARLPDFPVPVARKNFQKLGGLETRIKNYRFAAGIILKRNTT